MDVDVLSSATRVLMPFLQSRTTSTGGKLLCHSIHTFFIYSPVCTQYNIFSQVNTSLVPRRLKYNILSQTRRCVPRGLWDALAAGSVSGGLRRHRCLTMATIRDICMARNSSTIALAHFLHPVHMNQQHKWSLCPCRGNPWPRTHLSSR